MTARIPRSSHPAALRRALPLCAAALVVALAVAPSRASAAFDPNHIVSDEVFRAAYSMSADEIQLFLQTANPNPSTSLALKNLVTPNYAGVPMTAAQIIAEAGVSWQVNPRVLLVTLQKEQSLLTRTAPSQTALDWALGFGCPDGVPVDQRNPAYKGFGVQVWLAAQRLNGYGEVAGFPGTPWNRTRVFNDNGYTALPVNIATYKLYIYTPHVGYPDAANNYTHGNLLFHNVWNRWPAQLGDPLASPEHRPVYRFYNIKNGTHFYTASETERWTVATKLGKTYQFEGAAYSVNTLPDGGNSLPLHRFFNRRASTHFYTASEAEKADVIARLSAAYTYEGVAYNVSPSSDSAVPVYRFFNKQAGTHFYTSSEAERANVATNMTAKYRFEGVAFYIRP